MLLCWWCSHDAEADLGLPFEYNDKTKEFKLMGHFCSWECMKAWNINENGLNRGGIINEQIMLYKKYLCGKSTPTRKAPSRYHLKIFGGNLTIEEFRQSPEKVPNLLLPNTSRVKPLIISSIHHDGFQSIDDNVTNVTISDPKGKLSLINSAKTTAAEPLKLKRNKPLKRDTQNVLESSLGLKRRNA